MHDKKSVKSVSSSYLQFHKRKIPEIAMILSNKLTAEPNSGTKVLYSVSLQSAIIDM